MIKYNTIIKSITSIAFTGLWMVCPNSVSAQDNPKGELAITVGGIAASLDYDIPGTEVEEGQGINVGLEYTYYFSPSFGVAVGAEYQQFAATARTNRIDGSYDSTDFEQEAFNFRYTMSRIEEEQKMNFVTIPLMLVYQNQEYGFYVRGGAKIGLPISGKFDAKYSLNTSGYYPQYNGEISDPEFMGFGTFNDVDAKGDAIDTGMSYIAALEVGIRLPVGKSNFYAGLYLDYGLNDISEKNSHPVVYTVNDNGAGFTYNSLLNSENADNIKTMAFGVKLRYAFLSF